MKIDDQILIRGLKEKNKVIFDLVFTFYYSGLCAFANRFVNNRSAAEDIVQDYFVKLWENSCSITISSSLKSYLFASVKNRSLDYLKHQQVRKNKNVDDFRPAMVLPDELWEFTETELREIINYAMQKLPPRTREIFEMNRFAGLSNEQIANQLGISKRTVELQISNALKILRAELKDLHPVLLFLFLSAYGGYAL